MRRRATRLVSLRQTYDGRQGGHVVERQMLRTGALVWAVIGLMVALASLGRVNSDALYLVGAASVAFPMAAALASVALGSGRVRTAGLLLLVSVATPTYFAWALNVFALLLGLALLVFLRMTVSGRSEVGVVVSVK